MRTFSPLPLAGVLTLALTLGAALASGRPVPSPVFPPLNNPPSSDHLPGKFVWADLFTTDPAAATKFYTGLFGWTANRIEQDGNNYTVFSNGGRPVAGLAPRSASSTKRPSRWIGYIAVDNIRVTLARVRKAGGEVRALALDFPDRGLQAIITDNEGCPIGMLQSSSGDTPDVEPRAGDWSWFELYVKQPKVVADFYGKVFDYEVKSDKRTQRKDDFLLMGKGHERGGVAPLPESDDDGKGDWLGVVRVTNMDETLTRLKTLHGEVLLAPRPAAYESRFAIIADPTGGVLGLVEYVDNAPANPTNPPAAAK
jgi:predicted enzyme related to lactoylglutathione lyase